MKTGAELEEMVSVVEEELVEMDVQVREGRFAYKYRPNMDCQWLITAPTERDKVGSRRIHQPFNSQPGWDQVPVL